MDAKRFGTFLALRRREKGMTQAALAEKIHITALSVMWIDRKSTRLNSSHRP